MAATAPSVGRFFRDGWNVFDFTVVSLSLIPAIGPLTTIARVARLLRVARLVRYSPELRLIIATMLRSIPSIGHIALLMGLLIYVYAVAGVHFFGTIDPEKWGHLGRAALTLFEVITLEGWIDFQGRVIDQMPWAWAFFASFIVIAVFVMVNLLVAVVINNMESVKAEIAPVKEHDALRAQVRAVRKHLEELEDRLSK
jgi:voltage-gated sodium channel